MKVKIIILVFFILITVSSSFAQKETEIPYVTRTFTSTDLADLEVITSGGFIEVIGNRKSGYQVDMFVKSTNWKEKSELSEKEIEDRLDDYDIQIVTKGNKLYANARRKSNLKWSSSRGIAISFVVYAPNHSNTKLRSSGGSIKISDLIGNQDFATSGGSLKVINLEGNIDGKTSAGKIEVTNCKNNIKLITSAGEIKANELIGKIKLVTSGGSLLLNEIQGQLNASTSGGSIKGAELNGIIETATSGGSIKLANVSGNLKAATSAGSIEVSMDRVADYLTLSTSAGSIKVTMNLNKGANLNLHGSKVEIPLQNFEGKSEKNEVIGKINGGGAEIKLTTSSGTVYVNQ